jgi:hypothetical protein
VERKLLEANFIDVEVDINPLEELQHLWFEETQGHHKV